MSMPKISVICPVYKAEEYLHHCVDSILEQTFTDFELLLIDDGSPDKSGEICDDYAKKDSRVRVFHKENGGASSARNVGIQKKIGDFICFIDSDDYLPLNALEYMLNLLLSSKSDLVKGRINSVSRYSEIGQRRRMPENLISNEQYTAFLISNRIPGSVCAALYRSSLFKDVYFDNSHILGEDLAVSLILSAKHPKVNLTQTFVYNYFQNDKSVTRQKTSSQYLDSFISLIDFLENYVSEYYEQSKIVRQHLSIRMIDLLFAMLYRGYVFSYKDKWLINHINMYAHIYPYNSSIKLKAIVLILYVKSAFIGENLMKIIRLILAIKRING